MKAEEDIEIWKDIPEWDGHYQVSNLGNVKSFKFRRETILKPSKTINEKYLSIILHNVKAKKFSIHQLVAMAFLGHKPDGHKLVVDHINNNPLDNRVENLQVISNRLNNSKDRVNGTSKYTGVYWRPKLGKWGACISYNKKTMYLGVFETEKEAGECYQNALKDIEEGKEFIVKKLVYSSNYKGISLCKKTKKWRASIFINKKIKTLGSFNTENEAFEFRDKYLDSIKKGIEIPTKNKVKSSVYKGVYWDKSKCKWTSYVMYNNKTKLLGLFNTEEEAFIYRKKALTSIENGCEVVVKKPIFLSKYRGVTFDKCKQKWIASYTLNSKTKYIGSFKTEEEANITREKYLSKINSK